MQENCSFCIGYKKVARYYLILSFIFWILFFPISLKFMSLLQHKSMAITLENMNGYEEIYLAFWKKLFYIQYVAYKVGCLCAYNMDTYRCSLRTATLRGENCVSSSKCLRRPS